MRFLVTTLPRHPIPPEIALGLVGAMKAFLEKYKDKIEQDWASAGLSGGGAILNVDSHEELDNIMGEFPFGPFSKVRIMAMSDLSTSLDGLARQLELAVKGMPR